jgi:hypothetical protein
MWRQDSALAGAFHGKIGISPPRWTNQDLSFASQIRRLADLKTGLDT